MTAEILPQHLFFCKCLIALHKLCNENFLCYYIRILKSILSSLFFRTKEVRYNGFLPRYSFLGRSRRSFKLCLWLAQKRDEETLKLLMALKNDATPKKFAKTSRGLFLRQSFRDIMESLLDFIYWVSVGAVSSLTPTTKKILTQHLFFCKCLIALHKLCRKKFLCYYICAIQILLDSFPTSREEVWGIMDSFLEFTYWVSIGVISGITANFAYDWLKRKLKD